MLKYVTDTVPAGLETYYTQAEDGSFRLNVEGAVDATEVETLRAKNKEFRDTNTNLLKTNKALSSFEQLFGGIDKVTPDALQTKIDEMARQRAEEMVGTMKAKYDDEAKQLREGLTKTSGQLSQFVLGDQVQKAGLQHGVQETAYDDVMNRAASMFEVREGAVVFKGKELDAEGKPYTVQTWMNELSNKAPHLFKQSQGTGATRNAKTSALTQAPGQKRSAGDLLSSALNKMNSAPGKRLS